MMDELREDVRLLNLYRNWRSEQKVRHLEDTYSQEHIEQQKEAQTAFGKLARHLQSRGYINAYQIALVIKYLDQMCGL